MGVCESLFETQSSPSENNKEKNKSEEKNKVYNGYNGYNGTISAKKDVKGNFYRSPIGNSINTNNFNNISISQSQTTLGSNSIYPTQKRELFKYNKHEGNSGIGSIFGPNSYSSIMSGNKGESKNSDNNNSCGEFIIENQINKNMIGDEDFNNFMKMNKDNFGDNGSNAENKNNNNNNKEKDINLYNKKKNYKNNDNLKEIKEVNKEDESFGNEPPIPLDSEE